MNDELPWWEGKIEDMYLFPNTGCGCIKMGKCDWSESSWAIHEQLWAIREGLA